MGERTMAEQPVPDYLDDESVAPAPAEPVSAEPAPLAPVPPVGARLDLPEAGEWKRVSPKYVMVEIIGTVVFLLVVVILQATVSRRSGRAS